ncbi:DUF1643 domain-containing protein [Plectonema cf. radiosum LEGE 06105]|uniref:DUF1643 domain-containing protein n=1 Tax=Plectonema cf. radiosum LEGE 06105 TaxID=945769 RepID=A0A8J7F8B6_9CYAN|nr:DUF1643 domain-containing protein [Plectonema radiosum]MBE9211238.1 DUF1643 domain-containing protein [Plectonema cf. radiosum LEGE 06105]
MEKYACIDGNYRYILGRKWDEKKPQVTFVMLNPSTADANKNDNTLTKCVNFAKTWDYGSLEVVNLFAYRATDPNELCKVSDPIGSKNDNYIELATKHADLIIVAWGCGMYPKIQNRNKEVLSLISSSQQPLYCLGLTKDGHPCHPRPLGYSTQRILFHHT